MTKTYYKKIKGKNFDRNLIELADSSVKGKGDGRISLRDARKLLSGVKDANSYTDIEKRTMRYIRDNYKFTKEADRWFRKEIRKWAATKKSPVKKRQPLKKQPIKKLPDQKDDYSAQKKQEEPHYAEEITSSKKVLKIGAVSILLIIFIILGIIFFPSIIGILEREKPSRKPISKNQIIKKIAPTEENILYHTVIKGDRLVDISTKYLGDYSGWKRIYETNKKTIKDPNMIYPGQKLIIPK